MDQQDAVREFPASRRARITPEMAGVSPDHYLRLERGDPARFCFLDPAAEEFRPDRPAAAAEATVALLRTDAGLTLTAAYSAQPGTPAHDALRLIATWAAEPVSPPS